MVTTIQADVAAFGNVTSGNLTYPSSIAANDNLWLFCLNNNAGALTGTGGSGTGIGVPSGFTQYGSDHVYSSSMMVRVYRKTAAGTESGSLAVTWGGGSGGTASRTHWAIVAVPASYTFQNVAWNDQASLTTATVTVPAVTHTGTDTWFTCAWERGSSPSTGWTATPSGTTQLDSAFGTGSGACSGAVARADAVDRDGSVGAGTWQTNTANSAGRVAFTAVYTYSRVTKTTSTTWDVATAMSRVTKTTATTWNVRARVAKTTATTWDVAGSLTRISKTQATTWDVRTRLAKTQATTWNLASMISQAGWPAYIGHRGSDPGPEETLFAYDTLWGRSSSFWHEGDTQTLNDGTTLVASHDDTIDRMYASGPVSSGNISSMTPTQWDATQLHTNTGFSGPDKPAMRISAWTAKYGGGGTSGPAIGLWENKSGTDIADTLAGFAGQQGQVVINCSSLTECEDAIAAGFDACYQTNSPTFSQFTSRGIKYLSIAYTSMTGTIATNAISNGVKVLMYTVNSTANRDSMLALFSDTSYAGFISNKPQTIAGTSRITKTTATTWNVRARVAKTTATTFDVRSRVAKTTATTWNVRSRLAKTTATTWDVRSRVTKTQGTTWDVGGTLSRVVKTQSTTWDVTGRPVKTQSTTWDVHTRATKTTATTWDTRARLVKTTPTDWHVRARIGKTTATSWDVAARVAKAQVTSWDVLERLAKTTATTWDTDGPAPIPIVTPPERVHTVPAEDRTHTVPSENRTHTVPAESRTHTVLGERRG